MVADIAQADGTTPAQIVLAWLLTLAPDALLTPARLSAAIWQESLAGTVALRQLSMR